MTEAGWLSCDDPRAMLAFLRGKASDRKLRLFAVACARRAWFLDVVPEASAAADERFADGLAGAGEMAAAGRAAGEAAGGMVESHLNNAGITAACTCYEDPWTAAERAAEMAGLAAQDRPVPPTAAGSAGGGESCDECEDEEIGEFDIEGYLAEGRVQADLLRDVLGNPFRPVTADPRWLTSTAVGMARTIYEERAFDRLPMLADALEEAGCDSPDVLAHLRAAGPHVRGCWAVDLVLGKA